MEGAAKAAVRSVAGALRRRQRARGCTRKTADDGTGKRIVVGGAGQNRTCGRTAKPARGRVIHASGKRKGKHGKKEKRFTHRRLPRWFVVIAGDSTGIIAKSKPKTAVFTRAAIRRRRASTEKIGPTLLGPDQGEGKGKQSCPDTMEKPLVKSAD
jgi:hypothetical protein